MSDAAVKMVVDLLFAAVMLLFSYLIYRELTR